MARRLGFGTAFGDHVFTEIYKNNAWGDADSRSGVGSNLIATATVRSEIERLFEDLAVKSILDLPCGDFHWMRHVALPPDLQYTGADIVADLIKKNAELYGNERIAFRKLDLLADPLPAADLILCRDCLVHFSFADAARAILNLKRSRPKYLLITHFTGNRENWDIETGGWRPLNLMAPPFNFPPPLRVMNERCDAENGKYRDKSLALYELPQIPAIAVRCSTR